MRSALVAVAALCLAAAGAVSAATRFAPATHGHPPLLAHPGGQPKPLRLFVFVPSSYSDRKALEAFPNALAQSFWWTQVSGAYEIPRPISIAGLHTVTDMPKLTRHSKASAYQDWLARKLTQLGDIAPAPRFQTLYILFIPCVSPDDLDGQACHSHHSRIVPTASEPEFTELDSLVTVTGDPSASTNDKTVNASHEIVDASTNSGPGGWALRTAFPATPWMDSTPWVEHDGTGTIEAGDMSEGDRWYETWAGHRYEYQRIYSNAASKLSGDPAVPASARPYFNVYALRTSSGWYGSRPGAVARVRFVGWSTRRSGDWNVSAAVLAGGTNPTCDLTRTAWAHINNRVTFTLALATSPRSAAETWCVVRLTSSLDARPGGGDDYHVWYIGFVFKR